MQRLGAGLAAVAAALALGGAWWLAGRTGGLGSGAAAGGGDTALADPLDLASAAANRAAAAPERDTPPPLPAATPAPAPPAPADAPAAAAEPKAEPRDTFTLKVGESLPLTAEQRRELAIAARRRKRAGLPGPADAADRLAHVDPDDLDPDALPAEGAGALDGVYDLEPEDGAEPDTEAGVTTGVTGVVVDADTGGPVVGAQVALFSAFYEPHIFYDRHLGQLGGGVTDVAGRFRFDAVNLDDLHYRGGAGLLIVITHPTVTNWSGPPPAVLTEGVLNDLGTFRLAPLGLELGGQVRNRDGRPLADLLVTISPDNPVNVAKPQRQVLLHSLPHAVTDGDGRWHIAGLRPGAAWISVHAGLDGVLFQELTLTESRLDVNLSVRVGGAVTGRVIDRSGRPIASVRIDGSGNTTHSLADGTFLLENLDGPGPFTLSCTHHAYYPRQVTDVCDGQQGLEIVLEPLPVATLVVRQADDFTPVAECEIVYEGPPAALARIPTSPYRRAEDGRYQVICYPDITSVRVYRAGYVEQRLAATELTPVAPREVLLVVAPAPTGG